MRTPASEHGPREDVPTAPYGLSGSSKEIVVEIDPDLEDLIPQFLDNCRGHVEKLAAAVGGGDFETIRFLGHEMKGAGGGYGFQGISEIGGRLESAAVNRDTATAQTCIEQLSEYLLRVKLVTP